MRSRTCVRRYLLLGTDTDVGKTTVAAALCAAALRSGLLVAACKPVETGAPERGDLDVIRAIAGNAVRCVAGARLELAAAPSAAARAAGAAAPPIPDSPGVGRRAAARVGGGG